jgi:predicted CDP-diglyceride synthetase/phosphatidate cytidylyltransferase
VCHSTHLLCDKQSPAEQGLRTHRIPHQNLVGHGVHFLPCYPIQFRGVSDLSDGADLLRAEGILLHDQVEKSRPQAIPVGVPVDSTAVLLDLYRMVWDVHRLYPGLCVLALAAPPAHQQRDGRISAQCELNPMGLDADGVSHLAYFQFATPEYGAGLVLFLVVLTQLNDVVHHLASIYFGKRKVVPTANPYLTWEGFACAFVVTTAVSYLIYPYLTPLTPIFGIFSGMLISLSGFFGSLTVSVLKRDLLIGDDGKFEAWKKSYLSRVDSLTYTSPVLFHVIRYFFDFM